MTKPIFKVGDKVQIIPYDELRRLVDSGDIDELDDESGPGWSMDMVDDCGAVTSIETDDIYSGWYTLTGKGWTWKEEWLRPAALHINIMD